MGLAPKLVRAGVPAVVAIQERISLESARTFESCFFKHLLDHGLVDLAVNQARNTLLTAGQADAMAPVLFMRLRSGSLWGGEADTRGEVLGTSQPRVFWNRLVKQIQAGKCTPILGPRVHGDLLPSMPEIAEHWADTKEYQYPFPNRREMAGVAQYVALWTGEHYTRDQLIDTLMEHVRARLPESPPSGDGTDTLAGLIQAADWQVLVADNPNEVHRVLAKLDLPVYLTTNIDSSMVEALKARGRNPARSFCRWNERLDSLDSPLGATDEKAATVEQPLVYHLLGSDQEVESVVLSEDHYFSWLVRICAERDRIPLSIRERLSTTTLMFVGYGVYDWEFRVLLHGLVRNLTNRFDLQHVAVQMEPASEEGATSEPVRRFLERYLGKADIDVYWGSLPQFVAELREHWEGR
jgi:hypothetical protein